MFSLYNYWGERIDTACIEEVNGTALPDNLKNCVPLKRPENIVGLLMNLFVFLSAEA